MSVLIFALAAALQSSPAPSVNDTANCPVDRSFGSGLASIISIDDYPPEAIARGEQGAVCVRVTIGTNGLVRACDVLASSGSAILDETTCRLIRERARFRPAMGSAGTPVEDHMVSRIRWQFTD